MVQTRLLPGFVAVLAACACTTSQPRSARSAADLGTWLAAEDPTAAAGTTLHAAPSAPPSPVYARGSVGIPAREVPPARPRRSARVDVSLQKANMTSAFQFLADAGHFNLVMQEGLNAEVSATMRRVDPYDALLALAEANGVEVRFERDVVVVRKR